MKKNISKGFTLIELLVVVSIIALLVSILLPALSEARRQGKLAYDQNSLHQIGISLNMYAGENNNWYPPATGAGAVWDISYRTSNYIIKTGGDKKTFYCPLEGVKNPDEDIFWRHSECVQTHRTDMGNLPEPDDDPYQVGDITLHNLDRYGRVSGYVWLIKRLEAYAKVDGDRPPILGIPKRDWVSRSTQRFASETELVVDATISDTRVVDTAQWSHHRWGLYAFFGVEDKTAHLSRDEKPRDGNCLYVDGHVSRKQFDEMVSRLYLGYFWWW